jgi:serine/threonine protein phosphatase 1
MFSWLRPAKSRSTAYPSLAAGQAIYVIGDIHGRSDLIDRVHDAIDADAGTGSQAVLEICLGDYVDRGPDSAGVLERLIARSERRRLIAVRGNHEVMFEAFLSGAIEPEEWRRAGGMETLLSYGIDVRSLARAPRRSWIEAAAAAVPVGHRTFLASLRDAVSLDGYFFTHAGIRPGVALTAQAPDDLQWIRDEFLGDTRDHGAVVVHGHTPTMEPEFLPNRINLDTGAYLTGRLTCLAIDEGGPRLLARDAG